jgi:hypothetical protein
MTLRNYTQFFHRYNQDNTVDVICSECFKTIGKRIHTENAADCERAHVCATGPVIWLANPSNSAMPAH